MISNHEIAGILNHIAEILKGVVRTDEWGQHMAAVKAFEVLADDSLLMCEEEITT